MKRFRSFSILIPAGFQQQSLEYSPVFPAVHSAKSTKTTFSFNVSSVKQSSRLAKDAKSVASSANAISRRKRAKYAHVRPPPPLAAELAMMQFADGGNMETHIQRVMEAQAKASAGSGGAAVLAGVGVGDVYRGEDGMVWWDEDEELEYAHLLDGVDKVKAQEEADQMDWEVFGAHESSSDKENWIRPAAYSGHLEDRRPSLTLSIDSDLDPKYILPLPEQEVYPSFTSGPVNDHVLVSSRIGGSSMKPLCLPSRPGRRAPHLRKNTELEAFCLHEPALEHTVSVLKSLNSSDEVSRPFHATPLSKPRGIARRRSHRRVSQSVANLRSSTPSKIAVETARNDFIADSFAPPSPISPSSPSFPLSTQTSKFESSEAQLTRRFSGLRLKTKKSSSLLSVRGLFSR